MTPDKELSEQDRGLLDVCGRVQALGHFPSQRNLALYADYHVKTGVDFVGWRKRLIKSGHLVITVFPSQRPRASKRPILKQESDLARLLAAVKPRLTYRAIQERIAEAVGFTRSVTVIQNWVDRARDDATFGAETTGAVIKDSINSEIRERVGKRVSRIRQEERDRYVLGMIDRQSPVLARGVSPAEACGAILRDWKKRFSPKPPRRAVSEQTSFSNKNCHGRPSKRMEQERGSRVMWRHMDFGSSTFQ